MKHLIICCLAWSTVGVLQAQDPAAQDAMAALRPLVGKSFKGTFPNGQLTDEHHYTAVYGSHFIRDVHFVKDLQGKVVYEGETLFAKDPKTGKVVWWYWNVTGGYLTGTLEATNGKVQVLGENYGPEGQTEKVRSVMEDISGSAYKLTSYFWEEDAWQEQWAMTLEAIQTKKP